MSMSGGELFKTRLCKLYQRGHCRRESCNFAHGQSDLRGSTTNRRDYRSGGDLRDRLERRLSPRKRFSPGRDLRGRHGYADRRSSPRERGESSHSRSPIRGRPSRSASPASERRENKRSKLDVSADAHHLSDVSDEEDTEKPGLTSDGSPEKPSKSASPSPGQWQLEDELDQVNEAIDKLNDRRAHLESSLEKKLFELDKLSSRNLELESKLKQEQEDCKRIISKTRKFVKLYLRWTRAQEEVKKMQVRLHKLVDESPSSNGTRVNAHGDNLEANIHSDGELERSKHNVVVTEAVLATDLTRHDNDIVVNASLKTENLRKSLVECESIELSKARRSKSIEDGAGGVSDEDYVKCEPGTTEMNEINDKTESISAAPLEDHLMPSVVAPEKVKNRDSGADISSSALATLVEEEIVEISDNDVRTLHTRVSNSTDIPKLPSNNNLRLFGKDLPILPIPRTNQYSQYKGDDEEVDIEAVDDNAVI